ncbi:hypothetical protein [Vibrio hepatarius]|uniref:hypothetical protein n=1 Tax=Vibrio hepatarius TaxID=171383 RepID=UPI00148E32FE|nr:hypothetical protein [Vibrio hepatarius]
MDRNKIELELLAVAEDIEGLYIHHQPKKNNRRWGVRILKLTLLHGLNRKLPLVSL